ncbi:MAG: DUF2232 domain-containing protein [Hyphomicrobiaceae bacterium]|nr:DUF2232 domain-containing protein [Hyphomicrobiaceae bacterium]
MRGTVLIALAAGLIAAVVFLSATTGPLPMRLVLFLLTPLSLFLAGLGWGWISALVGGITGTIAIAFVTTPAIGAVFAISQAVPVVVLTYLAMLNRPAPAPGPDVDPVTRTEWYPVGRIVVWAASLSGAMALAAMFMVGPDIDSLKTAIRKLIEEVLKAQLEAMAGGKPMSEDDITRLADVGVYLLPALTALSWMMTMLLNLWLAGRITLASGRLARPWPDIPAMRFPRGTPLVLAAASAATFLPGYAALGASALSGAFYFAYVLMGLAVIHFVTRGQPWRPIALWSLYGALMILNTGISIFIAILGLADGFIPLRRGQNRPPGGGPQAPPGGPPPTLPPQ